jgi:CheY-specific phosphatase CheX
LAVLTETISSEHVGTVLSDAAQTVLETMFFTMAEGEAPPEHPVGAELMHTAITFSGEWRGTFDLQMPVACAQTIAESFVGAEPGEEMPEERVGEVICELANMVCGSTLSHLASDKIFDLSAPRLRPGTEPICTESLSMPNAVKAARGLNLGDAVVTFALAIEAVR